MKLKDDMLAAMRKELFLRKDELRNKTIRSLYFGGGTPSVLQVDEIKMLIDEVQKYYHFSNDIEITLEANPDDLKKSFLKDLATTEIKRLSIGTQSFFDEDLKLMQRVHNASEAESSIKMAQDFGFENLSIDLIYGAPTSNFEIWKKNLNKTIELQIPHISSYALTVEPKTILQNWIFNNKIEPPKESEQNIEFHFASEYLKNNGFQHYEISNFAKQGFHSKHNSAYWKYEPYLGIGPSSHSYDGFSERSWNIANNSIYIKKIFENQFPKETEKLSQKDRFNEMIMIGLRTIWGVDVQKIENTFQDDIIEHFQKSTLQKIKEGMLQIENNYLKIPEKHWFLADGIASDLFVL